LAEQAQVRGVGYGDKPLVGVDVELVPAQRRSFGLAPGPGDHDFGNAEGNQALQELGRLSCPGGEGSLRRVLDEEEMIVGNQMSQAVVGQL
jgi:hypothetical protein